MASREEKKLKEREEALEQREKDVDVKEEALVGAWKDLDAREKIVAESEETLLKSREELADLTRELETREKALGEAGPEPGPEPKADVKILSRDDEELIIEGLKAYGIDPQFVMAANIDRETGDAVILTNGGSRVRYWSGEKVEPLTYIQVTGINPEWGKKKVIVGASKEPEPEKTDPEGAQDSHSGAGSTYGQG